MSQLHLTVPELSYPFVFACSGCDNKIVVDRDAVLHQRGWMRDELHHPLFCPDCAGVEAAE
jgi:hypothetical protein